MGRCFHFVGIFLVIFRLPKMEVHECHTWKSRGNLEPPIVFRSPDGEFRKFHVWRSGTGLRCSTAHAGSSRQGARLVEAREVRPGGVRSGGGRIDWPHQTFRGVFGSTPFPTSLRQNECKFSSNDVGALNRLQPWTKVPQRL